MSSKKHIFLTGFMGAGKTTIGKLLSKELVIPVIDTDGYIENQQDKSIRTIFQEHGEDYFRDLETKALQDICGQTKKIITTGGGIVLRRENRQFMNENGLIIFLFCDIEETMRRLAADQSRPLFKQDVLANKKRFEERLPLYKQADCNVNTTNKTVEEIVTEIIAFLEG